MTLNECTTDENAITAAQVQGLYAFMASEAFATASDTEIERAAGTARAKTSFPGWVWYCR